ncbi:M28 family metallopeptidase [Sediminitomix flava]|uniref:Peptidase M28-like protein n=1 Tax=Sediminitomix flava TaxID=379075 RepID=A0A315YWA2_SEDFL|nr:M28 family peptidase [Sediminitomix flava]PWJ34119.1 peptidase M28-like protein [Sediminitomix flava]
MKAVKKHIKYLCSRKLHGRGYTFQGSDKAAEYIFNFYKSRSLKSYTDSYFQEFPLSINTFPLKPKLKIDDKKLKVGRDYIPVSTSANGEAITNLLFLADSIFENPPNDLSHLNLEDHALVISDNYANKLFTLPKSFVSQLIRAKALIFSTDKLTMGVGRYQLPIPQFYILEKHIKDGAKIDFELKTEFKEDYLSKNVIGYIEGSSKNDSSIVFSAHYDHLGSIGKKVYFPGGNDNASGVAMMLELIDFYTKNPPKYNVVFMAFGAEEVGLIGSKYYVSHPLFPLEKIRFLINIDLMASGEEGMTAVNGSIFKKEFEAIKRINDKHSYLPLINARGKAANSDHYFFTETGVPSFFFYLMGNWKNYHDIYDTRKLPLNRFSETFQLIVDFEEYLESGKI